MGQGQGRIDTAREPKHGTAEPVLASIIAHAQHQRPVDAFLQVHRLVVGRGRAAAIGDPADGTTLVVEIQRQQGLFEGRCAAQYPPGAVRNEGGAVEDQLVLTPDEICIQDKDAMLARAAPDQCLALSPLAGMEGRCVDVDQNPSARLHGLQCRALLPDVFADAQADLQAQMVEHQGSRTRLKMALLVENPVVWKVLLGILADDLAITQYACDIEKASHGDQGIAQHQGDPATFGADAPQGPLDALQELGAHEQVFRRIAGQRELGKDEQINLVFSRTRCRRDHSIGIPGDIPDNEVQLRNPDATSHGGVLSIQSPSLLRPSA
jgi:hypothetical protein